MFDKEQAAEVLKKVYGGDKLEVQQKRYEHLQQEFIKAFGDGPVDFFTSPGRTEILGNHTDHNHGKVLTGSIAMDTVAAARKNGTSLVHVISENYKQHLTIDLDHLDTSCKNKGTESLLIGIFEGFRNKGFQVEGFDAYVTTDVIGAAGVSSSASFEMLICAIVDYLSNGSKIDYVDYAKIGQYAENEYWSKQSGLLDQMACAIGGVVTIDFKNEIPAMEKLDLSYDELGYDLIIVNTGKGHADLSAEYSAVPVEMKRAAKVFGKEVLADVDEREFLSNLNQVRREAGDRAVMRALHFFEEQKRVDKAVQAIKEKDYQTFLECITKSGNSSWKWLQNCFNTKDETEQSVPVALALTELFIEQAGRGYCRVHGGGFAGVIAAVLPKDLTEEYVTVMTPYMGKENIYVMQIRQTGAIHMDI